MRALRALSSLLLLAPLAGCVLLVPSYEPGEHCMFEGVSECAKCMRNTCQQPIDVCCGNKTCREGPYSFSDSLGSMMAAVDTCGNGSTTCSAVLDSASTTPEGNQVKACVTTSCRAQCGAANAPIAVDAWTCATPRTSTATCAKCIYTQCATQLTTCCGSASCMSASEGVEENMAACVGGSAPDCVYLTKKVQDPTKGQSGVLRTCIATKCETACFGNLRPHTSCTLEGSGGWCTCSDAKSSSGDECSLVNVGGDNARCVVTSTGCVCGHYACRYTGDTKVGKCSCDLKSPTEKNTFDSRNTCTPEALRDEDGNKGVCCASFEGTSFSCVCDAGIRSCPAGTFSADSCDVDYFFSTLPKEFSPTKCSQ